MPAKKVWFKNKKKANEVAVVRGEQVFKQKYGRHKGEYFVGHYIQFINLSTN